MVKNLFIALILLASNFAYLNGQEIKQEKKDYTVFTIIPIGIRPPMSWKINKVDKASVIPQSVFPPGLLHYRQPSSIQNEYPDREHSYEKITLILGRYSQWVHITPPSSSINLFRMSKKAVGAPFSYEDYTTVEFPKNSKGGIVYLWQQDADTWDNPHQLVVPLETFVGQNSAPSKQGTLVVNTLPHRLAYVVDGSEGVLDPNGTAFIPAPDPAADN
ncbi:MAG: hypothetical protein LBV12_02135 [Puniceicoccales bacterium]|jgi:hypothetical protein|nr:hypothetical protein [Puniceicoccales bacterium]